MPDRNGRQRREELALLQATVRELQERLRRDRDRREEMQRRLSSARRTAAALRRDPAA